MCARFIGRLNQRQRHRGALQCRLMSLPSKGYRAILRSVSPVVIHDDDGLGTRQDKKPKFLAVRHGNRRILSSLSNYSQQHHHHHHHTGFTDGSTGMKSGKLFATLCFAPEAIPRSTLKINFRSIHEITCLFYESIRRFLPPTRFVQCK